MPLQVCFMWAGVDPGSPLQVFNAVVNVLFAVDIILNFFIPFRMPETGYLVKSTLIEPMSSSNPNPNPNPPGTLSSRT